MARIKVWTRYHDVERTKEGLRFARAQQFAPEKIPALWLNVASAEPTPEAAFDALNSYGALDFWLDEGATYPEETLIDPWRSTIATLWKVALLWAPPAADGGEYRMRHAAPPAVVALINERLAIIARGGVTIRAEDLRLVVEWATLGGYLWLSAAAAVREQHRFKRCRRCGAFFRVQRTDALFCSASCRNYREVAHG